MTTRSHAAESTTLPLSREEQWTLHSVLLQQIDRERTARDPSAIDPPPLEVFQAFETLDSGNDAFTRRQRLAIAETLTDYADRTDLGPDGRRRLERLAERFGAAESN
ncbi:MAG: hypothetical protein QXG03_08285 [Halalkalicoccus sp.]